MTRKFKLGSDPEIVGVSRATGLPVSAPEIMPAYTKYKPFKSEVVEVFADNANIEFNIPAASTPEAFVSNIREGLRETKKLVGPKYRLDAPSSLDYPAATLDNDYCKMFGCEPDYDAWTLTINEVLQGAESSTFRSCGGHIHIGHDQGFDFLNDPYGKIDTVKAFATVLGIPSLLIDDDESSIKRRTLYGASGAHRPKSYGVECRELSNFWLRHPQLVRWAFQMSGVALKMVDEKVLERIKNLDQVPIIIKNADQEQAKLFYKGIEDFYPEVTEYNFNVRNLHSSKTKYFDLESTWSI